MTTRRDFIKNVSATTAFSLMFPEDFFSMNNKKHIGIQLYTIRKELEENFEGSLIKLANIGFNTVETAGYNDRKFYGYKPKYFKKYMNNLGLYAQSSHANVQLKNVDQIIEDTLEVGMDYLVKPSINGERRKSIDDYKRIADEFNLIGERCMKSGLRFAYHNHAFEFEELEGQIPYNLLLENTDSENLTMQLDTYWMVYGGFQPVDYFKKYPGRFELFHIKDMDDSKKRESTEIGNGTIDFEEIFKVNKISGMKYFFLEQESFNMPVFKSLAISYNYLNNILA